MKLLLKREEEMKLFTKELTYNGLIAFIEQEFQIEPQSIEITFIDDEGDSITIASEDDIAIL
jgi:hypothetical protein